MEKNHYVTITVKLYNEQHPDKRVNQKYVLMVVAKFHETGSLANLKRNTKNTLIQYKK